MVADMTTLLIATRNQHKTAEIQAVLGAKFRYLTLNDYPSASAVVEDGNTFEANAVKKATELASWLARNPKVLFSKIAELTRFFVLADDSGLEVDALNGAPGVYSARFAAIDSGFHGNSPDALNNAKLLRVLAKVAPEKRTARFRCVLALTQIPYGELAHRPLVSTNEGLARFTVTFEGACEGKIALSGAGRGGFGYDPLFIPDGYKESFAELGEKIKNNISHRSKALKKLRDHLRKERLV